jgi:hypothetical protein
MKLPLPFINDKKDKEDYYLALLLTDEKVGAVILENKEGKIKIIGKSEEFFPTTIDSLSQKELIEIIDKCISRAEEILPPEIQTHKTVFGVKESWIDKESKKITKEYLNKLKKVCDSLDLTPIGFMVITEAIIHFLHEEEGAPLSAIFAEIGVRHISLSLLRGGKIIESAHGSLHESASSTIDALLKHFTVAVLPARIIIYSIKDDTALSQEFISHQWNKSLPFLHVPQITVLPAGLDAKAVAYGTATQIGLAVTGIFEQKSSQETIDEDKEFSSKEQEEEIHKNDTNSFGFVINQEITDIPPATEENKNSDAIEKDEQKISEEKSRDMDFLHKPTAHEHHEYDNNIVVPSTRSEKKKKIKIFDFLPKLPLPHIKIGSLPFTKNRSLIILAIGIISIIIMISGGLYYYINNVNTVVLLKVKPKIVEQTADVVFTTDSSNDFAQNIIKAKSIPAEIDGEMTITATGKKDIGEKAKGTVTFYNNENSEQQISAGTTIKSSNGLLFTTDKDITVSSASGDIFSGTKPGTTQETVTAKEIGSDYNFPSGTTFSVSSSNSLAAKNESAFSGGSKKTVNVVSKDDLTKLKTDLPKSLEDKARDTLTQKVSGTDTILPGFMTNTLDKASFDKKAGEEAKQVTINATVLFEGISYANDDMQAYAKTILQKKYSKEIDFATGSIKTRIKESNQNDDKEITGTIVLQAGLLPQIKADTIQKQLENKSLGEAKNILEKLPQATSNEIKFSPNISMIAGIFPTLPKNIKVIILAE